ncbi:hypothetical protein O181_019076 [Austropuccinia psidii MF-1]|uniref:Integrase catalytic domain-containing protein n=1 Tax=Austropuccinia psidii MF-1 TaxID=1389203 RepID=A0A9Q3CAT4_9BASI|nr:hypothetical protein [Austropuccinia psidii MF-1]
MTDKNTDKETFSIPILDSSNYSEWNLRMMFHLRSRDLLDVCETPLAAGATAPALNKWTKASHEAINIIASRLSHVVFLEVINNETKDNAHLLWTKINDQYASKRAINQGRVWMDWIWSNYHGDLQEYINSCRKMKLELDAVNIKIEAELLSFSILGKLVKDPKLQHYIEILTLNNEIIEKPDLILTKLQDFVNNSKIQSTRQGPEPSALSTSVHNQNYKITYYCTNGQHNPNCTSHTKEQCYAEHPNLRPPQKNKRRTPPNNPPSAHLSSAQALLTGTSDLEKNHQVIVDCGATHHMFNTREHFSAIDSVPFIKVSTGDASSSLSAEGIGTVNIICSGIPLTLKNCLFVPSLTCNLVSLLELFKEKLTIAREGKCFSLESSNIPALKGTIQNNLIILNYTIPKALITKNPKNIWHYRFGHPGSIPLKIMGLPYTLDQCTICDFNKAHALPFNHQFDPFVIAKKAMENLHNRSLKRLVSDRGGEFMNTKTPQHNGFAERSNRTILEKAQCLLSSSNLPNQYWAEAINTSTFLCNIVPTPSRHNLSPHHHREWKLAPTAEEGILLGYENNNTSYCILRLRDRKVVVAKHVVFREDVFPSLGNPTQVQEPLLVPTTEGTEAVDEFGSVESVAVVDIPPAPLPEAPHSVLCPSNAGSIPPSENEESLAEESPSGPPRRIKVIGPRHPTLISCELDGSNVLPYSRRPKALISSVDDTPRTYQGAIHSSNGKKWMESISKELGSMNRLDVWDVVDLDPKFKLVGTTWVLKSAGVDFGQTYSPTGRLNSLRSLIAFASSKRLEFHQVDIKSAFLNAPLAETVYLAVPQGLNLDRRKHCLRLKKAIYGLKQAPLAWYERLRTWLQSVGFSSCVLDACVFYRTGSNPIWLYIHVDDIAIFGKGVNSFKEELANEFEIKDLGQADLLLGIKITHSDDFVSLDQQHFTESLLDLYGMSDCKAVSTPLIPGVHLEAANEKDVEEFQALDVSYRSAIGCINYLSTATRPDLSYLVSALSQFLEKPGIRHWKAFLHVLKYLRGTQDVGLTYPKDINTGIVAYTDADWGNCSTTRRSVTGFLATMCGSLVLWKTRKQPTVLLSTSEAKYKALCDLTSELMWLKQWCQECGILTVNNPIPVHEDNQSCINAAKGDCNLNNKRMKHIDIQLHFIKEAISSSFVELVYTPTSNMLADFLTKSVSRTSLSRALDSLGVLRLGERGDVENKDLD